ncbi:hypothetical protein HL666_11450 [Bradyrhizobium sp. 83002]|uniref:hypothetical protein n=1 Tax=Bradyrhizobium aeschynomenes TaxID=2734909 RepID=UPI0015558241|nr:hypothetical protein [Bradyrhizobium aeschynomenes]NPU11379.1 hypothetical protein [Bradyrhizobium aeschynomenes]
MQIFELAKDRSQQLFAELADVTAEPRDAATRFVDDVTRDIGKRMDQAIRIQLSSSNDEACPSSSWAFALPLFGEIEPLIHALAKQAGILKTPNGRTTQLQALLQILREFLENARRAQSPGSAQRLKNWEAIDRVSLDIARQHFGTPLESRSSDEHLLAVKNELRNRYPTNKNVNVSLGTLRAYFDEFCAQCEIIPYEEVEREILALEIETSVWPAMDPCVDVLKKKDRALWEALAVETETFDDVEKETRQDFMARVGLSRRAFETRWKAAAAFLRDCIENSLEFQFRRSG